MPIHDWTTVFDGAFHDFHHEWISAIKHALNSGVLPADYYAMAEQVAGEVVADVLALRDTRAAASRPESSPGGTALLTSPPRTRFAYSARPSFPAAPRSRVIVRHRSRHQVVAVVEILSPANKSSKRAFDAFVFKAINLLQAGIHLLLIDVFPRGKRDPQGIHAAIWSQLSREAAAAPPDRPLTLVAYSSSAVIEAFVEPAAVGDELPGMPLFLTADAHVLVPLQTAYDRAFEKVPEIWRQELQKAV